MTDDKGIQTIRDIARQYDIDAVTNVLVMRRQVLESDAEDEVKRLKLEDTTNPSSPYGDRYRHLNVINAELDAIHRMLAFYYGNQSASDPIDW